MSENLKKEGKFSYLEIGEGTPIIILHGLMGGLSNFDGVADFFPSKGYKILIPELPIYKMTLLRTNVKNFAKYVAQFIDHLEYNEVILLGNSLGGHIGLLCTKMYPEKNFLGIDIKGARFWRGAKTAVEEEMNALVITGSSGLYESAMGESYPKRGDYEYIRQKAENVFYDPAVATKEIVDDVYETVNDRNKLIRTLAIAKSAIRHNMAKDLPKMHTPTCIIWGKNDNVTPPEVAIEFDELLPDSELFWIDKCGHAAMMEHPTEFNQLLYAWLEKRGL